MSEFVPNYGMGIAMDSDYPIFVWHDGQPTEAGTAVTAATITVTADTSITLGINGAADARVGLVGVIAHATWGTWGEIADEINGAQGWHCQLRDARWSAGLPDGMNTLAETSCFKTEVGVSHDNSDDYIQCCGIADYKYGSLQKNAQCALYYFTGQITSTNGSPLVQVYDCDDINRTDQEVFRYVLTSATEYAFPTNGPTGHPIYVAKPGHRIVVVYDGVDNLSAGRAYVIGGIKQLG